MKTKEFLSGFWTLLIFQRSGSPFFFWIKIAFEEKSAVAADLAITFLNSYKHL